MLSPDMSGFHQLQGSSSLPTSGLGRKCVVILNRNRGCMGWGEKVQCFLKKKLKETIMLEVVLCVSADFLSDLGYGGEKTAVQSSAAMLGSHGKTTDSDLGG